MGEKTSIPILINRPTLPDPTTKRVQLPYTRLCLHFLCLQLAREDTPTDSLTD
jgi:hypothetical protein